MSKLDKIAKNQQRLLGGKRVKNSIGRVVDDLSRRSRMKIVSSVANENASILSEFTRRDVVTSGQAMLRRPAYTGRNTSLHRYSPVM